MCARVIEHDEVAFSDFFVAVRWRERLALGAQCMPGFRIQRRCSCVATRGSAPVQLGFGPGQSFPDCARLMPSAV